jgi:hypothetical protein
MMKPLSTRKRLFYLGLFVGLFFVLIPFVILYSNGYRVTSDWRLQKTGGIYVYTGEPGVSVYVNGDLKKETTIFQRGIYISNLPPGAYQIEINKASSTTWRKNVVVLPQKVSEGYPFLIPLKPELVAVSTSTVSFGTTTISSEYSSLQKLFKTPNTSALKISSTSSRATSTPEALAFEKRNIKIWKDNNKILAEWVGQSNNIPFYFCTSELDLICRDEMVVYTATSIGTVDFFPGRNDVIIFSNKEGVFVTELDKRDPQNKTPILQEVGVDFRVVNEEVFIKTKKGLFKVEL